MSNNYELIQNMTIDELVTFLGSDCEHCVYNRLEECVNYTRDHHTVSRKPLCASGVRKWLTSNSLLKEIPYNVAGNKISTKIRHYLYQVIHDYLGSKKTFVIVGWHDRSSYYDVHVLIHNEGDYTILIDKDKNNVLEMGCY